MKSKYLCLLVLAGLQIGLQSRADAQRFSLGTAQSFAGLAGSTVTNTGPSVLTGDLGVSPGSSITGFPPGTVVGTIHAADAVAAQAKSDLAASYAALSGLGVTQILTGQDLGGLTLTPGVYRFASSAQLTGTLTLDYQGQADALFVFQIGSTLTTASSSSVTAINSAIAGDDGNIFWQVGSSATLGGGTAFKGNILASDSITMVTGANILSGRALALTGALTLDTNNISVEGIGFVAGSAGTFVPAGPDGMAAPEPGTILLWISLGVPFAGLAMRRRLQS